MLIHSIKQKTYVLSSVYISKTTKFKEIKEQLELLKELLKIYYKNNLLLTISHHNFIPSNMNS